MSKLEVKCPKCKDGTCVKDGIVRGKQRWRCRACTYRHTVQQRGTDVRIKRQALELYLEGLGFRSIGRILKVSHVAVYNWIKAHGKKIDDYLARIKKRVDEGASDESERQQAEVRRVLVAQPGRDVGPRQRGGPQRRGDFPAP